MSPDTPDAAAAVPAGVRGATITGWGTALPDNVVTNADFEARLDTTDEWITERTGIKERRHGGTTAGLAIEAGRAAMEMAGVTGDDIDLVVLCTTSPDYQMPVHRIRGARWSSASRGGAFDLNAACSGFVYGLVQAHGLIAMGLERVLLIGAETMSRLTDQQDRNTAILFGDGAGAVVLEATDDRRPAALLRPRLRRLAPQAARRPHRRLHADERQGGVPQGGHGDGRHRPARRSMPPGVTVDDVDLLVPHQANIRIIDAACSRLGIPTDRVASVLHATGNTSSASHPARPRRRPRRRPGRAGTTSCCSSDSAPA